MRSAATINYDEEFNDSLEELEEDREAYYDWADAECDRRRAEEDF